MKVERLGDLRLALGEGPVWHEAEQALYMVDSVGQQVLRFDPADGSVHRWTLNSFVGSLALTDHGRLILAMGSGIHLFDPVSGALEFIADPEAGDPVTQLNDGKTDRAGRFLVGSVATDMKSETCGLYSVERGRVTKLDGGFGLTNGPCFSPDDRTFYFADSRAQRIYAYDYDLASGAVGPRRSFCDTAALGGIPDGATVDTEGRLWSGICGGGVVGCWRPDGTLERTVAIPTELVSSVMFGGADLDTLYVTSIDPARVPFLPGGEDDGEAGSLYAVTGLDAQGLPEPLYVE